MESDTSRSLSSIRSHCERPLSSVLLEIQDCLSHESKWIDNIECLYDATLDQLDAPGDEEEPTRKRIRLDGHTGRSHRGGRLLQRKQIKPFFDRNYTAVSYTWEAPPEFVGDAAAGRYRVEPSSDQSEVRNVVLDRITKHVEHHKIGTFWIDRECIDQHDSVEKQDAVQSMDRVYTFSDSPIGLLSIRIRSKERMSLMTALLRGKMLSTKRMKPPTSFNDWIAEAEALEFLEFADFITSDPWWSRAWIYQEEYVSSTRMRLMIRHDPSLEEHKMTAKDVLGDLPGEVSIQAAKFRQHTTKFCLLFQSCSQQPNEICSRILQRAGQYNILLSEGGKYRITRPMSPIIFASIGNREITHDSDRLAIVANCCGYSKRLDTLSLRSSKHSLSLCLLALYLLNGEIIRNDPADITVTLSRNIFDYLEGFSLDSFDPPGKNELTFIKGCRFPSVNLSKEGIRTEGHLWKLVKVLEPDSLLSECPDRDDLVLQFLQQLSEDLGTGNQSGNDREPLVNGLENWLSQDESSREYESYPKSYYDGMVDALVTAVEDGKRLHVARLIHEIPNQASDISYRGIFWDPDDIVDEMPSYVFTAFHAADRGYRRGDLDTDKHVSLQVDMLEPRSDGVPQLITKKWMNGLCFFDEFPTIEAVFPWPTALSI